MSRLGGLGARVGSGIRGGLAGGMTALRSRDRQRSTAYRPALDGVRAVAVLSVMLYHADARLLPGGFLGVDVFFVLSGYLITGLLLAEWARWHSFDLLQFYARRARRLLPAIVLVVSAVAIWGAVVQPRDRLGAIRADGLATLLYVANWRFVIVQSSYFDQFGDPSPFRHAWSLAIEEQYYLFFPLLLLALLRWSRGSSRVVAGVLALLAGASALTMALLYQPDVDPSRIYYGTDTRIQELLVGSVLAVLLRRHGDRLAERLGRVGAWVAGPALVAVGVAFAVLTDQDAVLYQGGFLAFCVVVAVLLTGIEAAPAAPVGRLLSLAPVVWVGTISYGLYLWHWPLYIALNPDRTGLEGTTLLVLRVVATFAVATLSSYLVEQPVRQGALRRLPRRLGRAVAALALPLGVGVLLAGTARAVPPDLAASPFGPGAVADGQRSLLVVGDSIGQSLAEGFPRAEFPDWTVQASTTLGCGLGPHQLAFDGTQGQPNHLCDEVFSRWQAAVAKSAPEAVVLSVGSWEVFDHVEDDRILQVGSDAYATWLRDRLEQAHDVLTAGGAHLYVPNTPCFDQTSYLLQGIDVAPIRNDPKRAAAVNEVLQEFVDDHLADTTLVDDASFVCPDGTYQRSLENTVVREDGVHYTPGGAALVWRHVLMPAIELQSPARTKVLLVGDSVPLGLYERFPAADHPDLRVYDTTLLGCSAFPVPSMLDGQQLDFKPECLTWGESIPSTIDTVNPDVGVVFAGIGEQFDKLVDNRVLAWGTDEHDDWLRRVVRARIELFRSRGIPVIVPTVTCHQVADAGLSGIAQVINDDQRVQRVNDVLRGLVDEYHRGPQVVLLDLYADLCADGYAEDLDGVRLREDGLHFSDDGAAVVWNLLGPVVDEVALDSSEEPAGPSTSPSSSPSTSPSSSPATSPSSSPTSSPTSSPATSATPEATPTG